MVNQLLVAASTNYGASFTQAQQLTSGYSQNGFISPVIATSGQYVYVAYSADGTARVLFYCLAGGCNRRGERNHLRVRI